MGSRYDIFIIELFESYLYTGEVAGLKIVPKSKIGNYKNRY